MKQSDTASKTKFERRKMPNMLFGSILMTALSAPLIARAMDQQQCMDIVKERTEVAAGAYHFKHAQSMIDTVTEYCSQTDEERAKNYADIVGYAENVLEKQIESLQTSETAKSKSP